MSYTMYTPLNVWLDPASVTDVVAYIQNYLSENTIYSEEEIEELIHDYLIAHPELIGGVQSVNGKTGTVVLSASDINTANNVTIESVLASLSSQISSIAASVATNTSNITSLTGRVSTAETDLSNLKSSVDHINSVDGINYSQIDPDFEGAHITVNAEISNGTFWNNGANAPIGYNAVSGYHKMIIDLQTLEGETLYLPISSANFSFILSDEGDLSNNPIRKDVYGYSAIVANDPWTVSRIGSHYETGNTFFTLNVATLKTNFTTNKYLYTSVPDDVYFAPYTANNVTKKVLKWLEIDEDNFPPEVADDFIRIIKNFGIVGDSLASGEIAYNDGTDHFVDRYDGSWLSVMCRTLGATATFYSRSGMSTKEWVEDGGGYKTQLQSDTAKNAYFIALGTNDITQSYSLGSISDTSTADTFVGYYKSIIETITTKAPNAVIFMVSTYMTGGNYDTYNSMISEIANLYSNCYYVDYVNNSSIYTNDSTYANMNHFTTLGYVKVADTIKRVVNKIISDNKPAFKFFSLYN